MKKSGIIDDVSTFYSLGITKDGKFLPSIEYAIRLKELLRKGRKFLWVILKEADSEKICEIEKITLTSDPYQVNNDWLIDFKFIDLDFRVHNISLTEMGVIPYPEKGIYHKSNYLVADPPELISAWVMREIDLIQVKSSKE